MSENLEKLSAAVDLCLDFFIKAFLAGSGIGLGFVMLLTVIAVFGINDGFTALSMAGISVSNRWALKAAFDREFNIFEAQFPVVAVLALVQINNVSLSGLIPYLLGLSVAMYFGDKIGEFFKHVFEPKSKRKYAQSEQNLVLDNELELLSELDPDNHIHEELYYAQIDKIRK